MRIEAVTTFNEDGMRSYGARFLSSFEERWADTGVGLRVYTEGFSLERQYRGVTPFDLEWSSPWLKDFKKRHKDLKRPAGFRHDAVRFSHKVAALCHAAWSMDCDYLIWLDGDIFTHSDFTRDALKTLLPTQEWIAWLDRARVYPECGFYIINCRSPFHEQALATFEDMYVQDRLFELTEWHDSFVLQAVVRMLNAPAKSLSGRTGFITHHPLVNGPLGQWFDHLKGKRKDTGRSHSTDVLVKRDEPYWSKK